MLLSKKNLIASLSITNVFGKPKTKPYDDKVTNFYDKEILKVNSNHTCLAVISLDSAPKKDKNYYPQLFLKDCKYN